MRVVHYRQEVAHAHVMMIFVIIAVIVILYFFMIMPRMMHRPSYEALFRVPACDVPPHPSTPSGHLPMYAHRGLHDNATDAPENSLAAFRKAVDAGYGIELDVQITKDGKLVVFHDDTLERMARGEGRVREYTLEELQAQFRLLETDERIPSFEEVLAAVGGKVPLIVEIKEESTDLRVCVLVAAMLDAYKGVYCIESFNPMIVRWYKKNRPHVVRGQLSDAFHKSDPAKYKRPLYFLLTHLLFNFLTKPDFIAYHHKYSHEPSRNICRHLYRALSVAWTIQSREDLAKNRSRYDLFIFDSFDPLAR